MIPTAIGQEQADARYVMTDNFLFGFGKSYATIRCNPVGIGTRSPISSPTRPWSDGLLDTSSEFIASAGDEFDIVVDYVKALRKDPIVLRLLGQIKRTAAFGYSASGSRLRGLLRIQMGKGLFDFSPGDERSRRSRIGRWLDRAESTRGWGGDCKTHA